MVTLFTFLNKVIYYLYLFTLYLTLVYTKIYNKSTRYMQYKNIATVFAGSIESEDI